MDTALQLKKEYDTKGITDMPYALSMLEESELMTALLSDFEMETLNLLHRLSALSEIPYTNQLPKVQGWLHTLVELSFCGDGFSFSGKSDDLLSCYNSMITSVLIRMQHPNKDAISKGIAWILKYQHVERGKANLWPGSRIEKYGGCMKKTPCYIGVVKAVIALSDYKKHTGYIHQAELEEKLAAGLEYILEHQLYLRKNSQQPITKDITKLHYPFSYKTNIIEILRLLRDNSLDSNERCHTAKTYLHKKRHKNGYWKVNSIYVPKTWISFDKTKEDGLWVSHELEKLLDRK